MTDTTKYDLSGLLIRLERLMGRGELPATGLLRHHGAEVSFCVSWWPVEPAEESINDETPAGEAPARVSKHKT